MVSDAPGRRKGQVRGCTTNARSHLPVVLQRSLIAVPQRRQLRLDALRLAAGAAVVMCGLVSGADPSVHNCRPVDVLNPIDCTNLP